MKIRGRGRSGRASRELGLSILIQLAILACSGDTTPTARRAGVEPQVDVNVVLISIDTLRADHLGSYGYDRPTSPFLDDLAARGVLFENCIAQSTWTVPSHAAMLTSLYPTELGIGKYPDPGRIPEPFSTLAEVLWNEGFDTAAFTDAGWVTRKFGFAQGFIEFNQEAGHMHQILPRIESWLARGRPAPLFLFVHTYDVHLYNPPPQWAQKLVRPYSGSLDQAETLEQGIQNWDDPELLAQLDEDDMRYIVDLYDASILYVDDMIRRLVASLEETGHWNQTLLVITSDHGEQFLEHDRMGHGKSNFEEEIRIPLIVRLPGDAHAGRRVATPVRSIDIMPTVLELVETASPLPQMRGRSLVPLLRGEPDGEVVPAFTEKGHKPFQSLRGARFKVVRDPWSGEHAIYDLRDDPLERNDLGPEAPAEALALSRALDLKVQTLKAPGTRAESPELTPEERQALQALGYLSESPD